MKIQELPRKEWETQGRRKIKKKEKEIWLCLETYIIFLQSLRKLHWLSALGWWNNFNVILMTMAAFISTYTDCSKMFRQHLFICAILFYLHKWLKRNITSGQGSHYSLQQNGFSLPSITVERKLAKGPTFWHYLKKAYLVSWILNSNSFKI